jgi:hypothetical protein
MTKLTVIASVGLGLVLIGYRCHWFPEPPAFSSFIQTSAELARQTKYLHERIRAHSFLLTIQDDILQRLAQGELSLPQACDQLYQSAREFYPQYLRFPGVVMNSPLKEKIARDIVVHFRLTVEDTPSFLKVVLRLEQEMAAPPFRDWCRQPWTD